MKKAILVLIAAGALLSFTVINYSANKSTCEAVQVDGLYMFVDSRPVSDFDYLGTVKGSSTFAWSEKYQDVKDKMIRKTKKEFPGAEGIIFSFNGDKTKVEAIKFR